MLGFASWQQVFAVLAVIGIVYGASVALVQKDLKFVVGYSSVSHMGFVLLGLMTLNQIGLSGAVYQMFSHGIIAGLLFAVVGTHGCTTAPIRAIWVSLSRIPLARMIPFAAVTFVLAFMASIGLPGFSGFIAELEVLIGSWRAFPWMAWIAGLGILIGIAFSWRALQATFFGEPTDRARAGGAADHATGASGSVPAAREQHRAWSLSQAADESDFACPQWSLVRAASPG